MHLKTRNVNSAFTDLVELFHKNGLWTQGDGHGQQEHVHITRKKSRNGPVLMIEEPVTITYSHPRERVLFNPVRDANPFFHMMEALWMLAGRNDVGPLAYYCGNVKHYSDDGETFNGAYGYRWRHSRPVVKRVGIPPEFEVVYDEGGTDQLDLLVSHLKANPESRRAVLSMWNVEDDLLEIGDWRRVEPCPACTSDGVGCPKCGAKKSNRLEGFARYESSKDVCCNLNVMFAIREERYTQRKGDCPSVQCLDMTVTNRSNDLLWGMLGANYVHFTFLQEYMAARLGVEIGVYHHISNNLHVYCERPDWKPVDLLSVDPFDAHAYDERGEHLLTVPLVRDPETFERELPRFVEFHNKNMRGFSTPLWEEPFLREVAGPMLYAFHHYKHDGSISEIHLCDIQAEDWRLAATGWLERRRERREQRAK